MATTIQGCLRVRTRGHSGLEASCRKSVGFEAGLSLHESVLALAGWNRDFQEALTLAIAWPQGVLGEVDIVLMAAQVDGDVGLSRYAADSKPLLQSLFKLP